MGEKLIILSGRTGRENMWLEVVERAKYMLKPYALVRGIAKKSSQPIDGRDGGRWGDCIFVPVCYNSFSASCIYELTRKFVNG